MDWLSTNENDCHTEHTASVVLSTSW